MFVTFNFLPDRDMIRLFLAAGVDVLELANERWPLCTSQFGLGLKFERPMHDELLVLNATRLQQSTSFV